jgi:hypothetical protein
VFVHDTKSKPSVVKTKQRPLNIKATPDILHEDIIEVIESVSQLSRVVIVSVLPVDPRFPN